MSALPELFDAARARLAGVPTEALGEIVIPRRVLGVSRPARIVPRGRAWHLGVLLVAAGSVLATADVLRSRQEAPRGFTAENQRRRSELAAAAFRGGFAAGSTVHVGWSEVDLVAVDRGAASGPLAMIDRVPSVRWSPAAGFVPLAAYLDERIELLAHPLPGAT